MKISFPYGKEFIDLDVADERLQGVLVSNLHHYEAKGDPASLVEEALANPIGSPKLSELAKGKKNIVLIASDHTRPVPSKVIVPPMLREIRKGNPDADITILISTGCHRGTTKEELVSKFGEEIVAKEKIVVHDCDNSPLAHIGTLPSGGELIINKLVVDADLVCSEGFIEPHFFAGFSGARKSILPGIASRTTVLANHCSEFIADPHARTGILEGNPIHKDMVWAARTAKLASRRLSALLIKAISIQQLKSEVPPRETKGKVTPVKGRMSSEPNTFMASWVSSMLMAAQAAME